MLRFSFPVIDVSIPLTYNSMDLNFKFDLFQDPFTVFGKMSYAIFGQNRMRHRKHLLRIWREQQSRILCLVNKVKNNVTDCKRFDDFVIACIVLWLCYTVMLGRGIYSVYSLPCLVLALLAKPGELAARRDRPSVNPRGCYDFPPKRRAGPDSGGFRISCVYVTLIIGEDASLLFLM